MTFRKILKDSSSAAEDIKISLNTVVVAKGLQVLATTLGNNLHITLVTSIVKSLVFLNNTTKYYHII